MFKVISIIPGAKNADVPNNYLGGHHRAGVEKSSGEVFDTLGGGGKKRGLWPLKGIGGLHAGAKNPPGRCPGCNCVLPGPHSKRCRRK